MEIRVQIDGIADALHSLDAAVSPGALRAGLLAAAFFVEGQAKLKAPVDLGFLRASIYSATQGNSNYADRLAEATMRNPNEEMLPESSSGPLEAIVAVGADYGLYQEMGTRFMPAQPFMRPALENNRARIGQIIGDVLRRRGNR